MGLFNLSRKDRPRSAESQTMQDRNVGEKSFSKNTGVYDEPYEAPVGPPPGRHIYEPPAGPPPGHLGSYIAPPGPPPEHRQQAGPTAPGSMTEDPPPYHDWTVIPDTSLLPPPPSVGHEQPYKNNADSADADRAHDWCRANKLVFPHQPTSPQVQSVRTGDIGLLKPQQYIGDLTMSSKGRWKGSTRSSSRECCISTASPLYFPYTDSPTHTKAAKTIYYEVEILSLGSSASGDDASLAIGFCAMPYPTWRMPGWERASLAIHSDDGHRYVNDTWGGKDFTTPFKGGDTVGIGMTFSLAEQPPEYNVSPEPAVAASKVEVFFTRNGRNEGGWNIHEELDHDTDLGVEGLDGLFDLYGAIGVFGAAEFQVNFRREQWLWRPR